MVIMRQDGRVRRLPSGLVSRGCCCASDYYEGQYPAPGDDSWQKEFDGSYPQDGRKWKSLIKCTTAFVWDCVYRRDENADGRFMVDGINIVNSDSWPAPNWTLRLAHCCDKVKVSPLNLYRCDSAPEGMLVPPVSWRAWDINPTTGPSAFVADQPFDLMQMYADIENRQWLYDELAQLEADGKEPEFRVGLLVIARLCNWGTTQHDNPGWEWGADSKVGLTSVYGTITVGEDVEKWNAAERIVATC